MSDRDLSDLRSRIRLLESQMRRMLGTQHLFTSTVDILDENVELGEASALDFVGGDVSVSIVDGVATVTVDAATIDFEKPRIKLAATEMLGASGLAINSDATIRAFDAGLPEPVAFGDTPSAGTVGFAARRDHDHGPPLVGIRDEGANQGVASVVNFVGSGVAATVAGEVATITVTASSGGSDSWIRPLLLMGG